MIRCVTIKNFKCLRDVTVNLEPFTVFVGTNGSGKTSFLQALDLMCRAFRSQPAQLNGEFQQNRSYGTTGEVELSCLSNAVHFRYRTKVQADHSQGHKWAGDGAAFAEDADPLNWKRWEPQHAGLPNSVWLRLETPRLRDHQAHGNDRRLMNVDGSGMHAALASMALEDPDEWQKLQADLRRIVPAVLRLRHTPQSELLFDTINGKGLKANQVSEGTLLTLGLLTAIHGVNKPGVLLLDDLDRALHPKAQRELIRLLRGVQTTNPDIQIVGSTHSPYLLDEMTPGEVMVTYLRDDGSTACEPLTHHPKFDKWKDEFHPGEMWSFFGENWVAEPEVAAK